MKYVCQKCKKEMDEKQYYTYKDGSKVEMCKKCLTMFVDNYDPSTFLWLLEKMDVPYIEAEWNVLRDKAFAKDPTKMNSMSVFGKYLSKMKLKQWRDYTWADTERLKLEHEAKVRAAEEEVQKFEEDVKEKYKNNEITEAEYKTLLPSEELKEEYDAMMRPVMFDGGNISAPTAQTAAAVLPPVLNGMNVAVDTSTPFVGFDNPYDESQFISQDLLPDIGSELSEEDKIYLAIKWGRLYRVDEWVALETLYEEFMASFDIKDAARLDTLKKICKTSLKMDAAIDCGDIDGYQKLSRTYDSLMKSAKFTEAQKKEEKVGDFDCIGQIVSFAESKKGGGKIPRHKIEAPLDKFDKAIDELKLYYRDYISNDPTLKQQIENWIKKREILAEQKADEEEARRRGFDHYEITDEDLINMRRHIFEEQEEDRRRLEDADS